MSLGAPPRIPVTPCPACQHLERRQLDAHLASGDPPSLVASMYDLTEAEVVAHQGHPAPARPAPARGPCCSVGARSDVAAINAMLLAGSSHRAVAPLFKGLNPTAVYRHKPHVSPDGTASETPKKQAETPVSNDVTIPLPERPHKGARTKDLIPKSPGDDALTSPKKLVQASLEQRAVDMRVAGSSWESIAAELGISVEDAIDLAERVLIRTHSRTNKKVELLRAIELRRCDDLIAALWPRATDPALAEVLVPKFGESGKRKYDGQDKAADRVLKAMERRAQLAGLDAPTTPAVQINFFSGPEFKSFLVALLNAIGPFPGAVPAAMAAARSYMQGGRPTVDRPQPLIVEARPEPEPPPPVALPADVPPPSAETPPETPP